MGRNKLICLCWKPMWWMVDCVYDPQLWKAASLHPLLWHLKLWLRKNNLRSVTQLPVCCFSSRFFGTSCLFTPSLKMCSINESLSDDKLWASFLNQCKKCSFNETLGGYYGVEMVKTGLGVSHCFNFNPRLSSLQTPRHRGGLFARHVPDVPLLPNTTPPLQPVHYSPTHVRNHFASCVTGLSFTLWN